MNWSSYFLHIEANSNSSLHNQDGNNHTRQIFSTASLFTHHRSVSRWILQYNPNDLLDLHAPVKLNLSAFPVLLTGTVMS